LQKNVRLSLSGADPEILAGEVRAEPPAVGDMRV